MKLLIVSDSFLPRWDGVARFLSEILPFLAKKFEVSVVAPDFKGNKKEFKNVKISYVPTYNFSIGDYTPPKPARPLVNKLIRQNDIIWVQTIGPLGNYAINYAHKKKKKIIGFTHSVEWELFSKSVSRFSLFKKGISHVTKKIMARNYNKCDLLIVPGKETEKKIDELGIKTKKKIVHLGVDIKKFSPSNKKVAKKNIGIDEKNIVIGFVGRIGREKDLPTLVSAFNILHKKHDNVVLIIVGAGNKKEEAKLLGDDIMHIGKIDNVVPYLQAMDIYVLPSLTETSSLTTMEAMACKLPVITTDIGQLKVYVKDNFNGLKFHAGDSEDLKNKIERLIKYPTVRTRIAREARKTIEKDYRWRDKVKEIIEILMTYKNN